MGTQPPAAVAEAAKASQKRWGIPASVSIAQWALESAWGKSMPKGSNNPFGIKARKGEPSVIARTREVINGKSIYVDQAFRAYASLTEAFEAHAKLLATGVAHKEFRDKLPNVLAAVYELGGGTSKDPRYATDPNYGKSLTAIIKGSNLLAYDR